MTTDYSLERGLPVSIEAERSIIGGILLDNSLYDEAASLLTVDHFSLDAPRRIFSRMKGLRDSDGNSERINKWEASDKTR